MTKLRYTLKHIIQKTLQISHKPDGCETGRYPTDKTLVLAWYKV